MGKNMKPEKIGEITKNSMEKIVATVQEYKNCRILDLRVYYQDLVSGKWLPTKKGLSLQLDQIPEIEKFIKKAKGILESE